MLFRSVGQPEPLSSKQRNRDVDARPLTEEVIACREDGLRPKRLDEYIGQSSLKEVLGIAVKAAKMVSDFTISLEDDVLT